MRQEKIRMRVRVIFAAANRIVIETAMIANILWWLNQQWSNTFLQKHHESTNFLYLTSSLSGRSLYQRPTNASKSNRSTAIVSLSTYQLKGVCTSTYLLLATRMSISVSVWTKTVRCVWWHRRSMVSTIRTVCSSQRRRLHLIVASR